MKNDGQLNIIRDSKTPAAVIAGPGTGKTFTIVGKIIDLVKNQGLKVNRILVTTFTRKAALELNQRIITEFNKEGINSSLKDLKIGNFHTLALDFLDDYRVLGDEFFTPEVIDSYMEAYILEKNLDLFNEIDGFKKEIKRNPVRIIQQISESITNNLIDIDLLKNSDDPKDILAFNIYNTHLKILKDMNLVNFQMILKNFYDLLDDEVIGKSIRDSIDYVIIDEYQDTNFIQQEIAFKLLRDKNIMVFGDDDQSLYSFRGADPKNLLEFDKICKEKLNTPANIYRLDINYRSNQEIIEMSNKWMDVEIFDDRFKKDLRSVDPTKNTNSIVRAQADKFDNLLNVIKLLNKKINLSQIAFLFPTFGNPYPQKLQQYFEENGIKVFNRGSNSFFKRFEIKAMMYILVKIYGDYPDNLDLYPYMSYEEKNKYNYRAYIAEILDDERFKVGDIDKFITKYLRNENILLSKIIYEAFSLDIFKNILDEKIGSLESDRAMNNVSIFTQKVSTYEELFFENKNSNYYLEFIYGYMYYFFKTNSIREFDENSRDYDAVEFMTIHASKGLEFEAVFVSSLNDYPREEYPKFLSKYDNKNMDFESKNRDFYRKYYTAFTRSKNLLAILDNSRDIRIKDFIKDFNNSSILSSIDFIKREEIKEKPILAYTTDIEIYNSCPLKYKFIRKLGFKIPKSNNLKYGSRVHQLAEYSSKSSLNDLDRDNLLMFLDQNQIYKTPILNFMNKKMEVSGIEANFKADRDFYILQGNIDIILKDNSILDIKTGDYDKNSLIKYQNQLITYKNIMKLNGIDSLRLYLYFIEKDKLIEVRDKDFDIDSIDDIAKNIIEENIYDRTDDLYECSYCPMKYYCERA